MTEIIFKSALRHLKFCLITWLFFQFWLPLGAQDRTGTALLSRANTGPYKTIERSDWSRYDNGKYSGHVFREVRATLNPRPADSSRGFIYRGNFLVMEETLRDMRQSAQAVDAVVPVSFQIFPSGDIKIEDDRGFPSLRGFPSFPPEPVRPGSRWTAEGIRVVDPLNEGYPVTVPIIAEYEFKGEEMYRDIPVYRISAQYAARFRGPQGSPGVPGVRYFTSLQGQHTVEILLRAADGLPLLMRDTLDETYSWPGGDTVRFRGFTLTFGEGTVPLNSDRVIASIGRTLNGGGDDRGGAGTTGGASRNGTTGTTGTGASTGSSTSTNGSRIPPETINIGNSANIDLEVVPEGIRLTVKDIRFVPDSDQFLPDEYPRLDQIARALKEAPDRTFLVEGHTAAIGRAQGEMELSIQRAKRMVDELVKRGIGADRFLYKGWGGTKPLGDNSTEPGRALNRRVEITILE